MTQRSRSNWLQEWEYLKSRFGRPIAEGGGKPAPRPPEPEPPRPERRPQAHVYRGPDGRLWAEVWRNGGRQKFQVTSLADLEAEIAAQELALKSRERLAAAARHTYVFQTTAEAHGTKFAGRTIGGRIPQAVRAALREGGYSDAEIARMAESGELADVRFSFSTNGYAAKARNAQAEAKVKAKKPSRERFVHMVENAPKLDLESIT